jgi:hypothetical protein
MPIEGHRSHDRIVVGFITTYDFGLVGGFLRVPGIKVDGIRKNFKVMFPEYGFRLMIFRLFGEHIS